MVDQLQCDSCLESSDAQNAQRVSLATPPKQWQALKVDIFELDFSQRKGFFALFITLSSCSCFLEGNPRQRFESNDVTLCLRERLREHRRHKHATTHSGQHRGGQSPPYAWRVSSHPHHGCRAGLTTRKPLPWRPHTPTWLPTAFSKLVPHDASSVASPSSHVPWKVSSRR